MDSVAAKSARSEALVIRGTRTTARLAAITVAVITVASFLGGFHYSLDLLSNFRPLIAFAALVLALVLWMLNRPRLGVASAAFCAIGLAGLLPSETQPLSGTATPVRSLKVITFNAWWYNRQMDDVERFLKQADADIIVLQEFGRRTLALRKGLEKSHPWQFDCQNMESCDIAIFSRIAWSDTGAMASRGPQPPLAWASFGSGRNAFTVAGTHFTHPTEKRQIRQVETLGSWIAGHSKPVILTGDFNAAPWSHAMTRLAQKGGIRLLSGIRPSWPARPGFPLLPIDHILVSPGIRNLGVESGPYLGSDHLPIIARLGIPH